MLITPPLALMLMIAFAIAFQIDAAAAAISHYAAASADIATCHTPFLRLAAD